MFVHSAGLFLAVFSTAACGNDGTSGDPGGEGELLGCPAPVPSSEISLHVTDPAPSLDNYVTTDDTVLDQVTGLMWERQVTTILFTPTDKNDPTEEIENARAYCTSLTTAGYEDWRLPTRLELISIQDHSRASPAINVTAFPDSPAGVYWSSTRVIIGPTVYYGVDFNDGGVTYDGDVHGDVFARCVRSDTSPPTALEANFTVVGDLARDEHTGLIWQRTNEPKLYDSPADAAAHCEALVVDGCSGFRLPTAKELNTLTHETTPPDPPVFLGPNAWFWSSTHYERTPGFWFALSSGDGCMYPNVQADGARARCVK